MKLARWLVPLLFVLACGEDGGGGKPRARPAPETADPLAAPLAQLRARSQDPVSLGMEGGFPSTILGRFATRGATRGDRARNFIADAKEIYGQTSPRLALDVRRSGSSRLGDRTLEHVVLHQTVDGVPVENGEISVVFRGDDVVGTFGRLVTASQEVDTVPSLLAPAAIRRARELRPELEDAPLLGEPTLVVWDAAMVEPLRRSEPRLAWRFNLGATLVYLDARSGELLWAIEPDREAAMPIEVRWDYGPYEELIYDQGTCFDFCPDTETLVDYFQTAYDHYLSKHLWLSYDGSGAPLDVYRNADVTDNAMFRVRILDEEFHFTPNYETQQTVGHEFTHGVITHNSDLTYAYISGALNESVADAMGLLIADLLPPGQKMTKDGSVYRDMCQPGSRSTCIEETDPDEPNCSTGRIVQHASHVTEYVFTTDDNGGVHINSGIFNRAWCSMAERMLGAAYTRAHMREMLGEIVFHAIQALPSNASFLNAQAVSTVAALQQPGLPGNPVFIACLVRDAWREVGVSLLNPVVDPLCDDVYTDNDSDGRENDSDNCPDLANPSQFDADLDGEGDLCDSDLDGDGVPNATDNCPTIENPGQENINLPDAAGDACDADWDDDTVPNDVDNCPTDTNPVQHDTDGDGVGNACDLDRDGDGVDDNAPDNCLFVANPDQTNNDGDDLGDACDPCRGVVNEVIAYSPGVKELGIDPQPYLPDADADGTPDDCDDSPRGRPALVGGVVANEAALVVGASATDVTATVSDTAIVSIPIDPCPSGCGDYLSDEVVSIELPELPAGTRAVVVDERGQPQGSNGGARKGLTFRPRGGRSYALVLQGGSEAETSLLTSVVLKKIPVPTSTPQDCGELLNGASCALGAELGRCRDGVCVSTGPTEAPEISSFTASPALLPAGGGDVTLAWNVSGADTITVEPGPGDVTGSSQVVVPVTEETTFTLTAVNEIGTTTATATVTITRSEIHVNATTGVDTAPGTAAEPVLTIDRATQLAVAGDTIVLQDGVHEIRFVALPAGVNLEAQHLGAAQVRLVPLTNGNITAGGDNTVRGIHFVGPNAFGFLRVTTGTLNVEEVQYTDVNPASQYPLIQASGNAAVTLRAPASGEYCVTDCRPPLVVATESAQVTVVGGRVTGASGGYPLFVAEQQSRLTLDGVTIENGTKTGSVILLGNGGILSNEAEVRLTGVTIRNATSGATARVISVGMGSPLVELTDTIIEDNAGIGLFFEGGGYPFHVVQEVLLTDVVIAGGSRGIDSTEYAKPHIVAHNLTVERNSTAGIRLTFAASATIDIEDGSLSGNGVGLDTRNSPSYPHVIKLRNVKVEDNAGHGLIIAGAAGTEVDLGRDGALGGNVIRDNDAASSGLYLALPAGTLVWAVGNTWIPDLQGASGEGAYVPTGGASYVEVTGSTLTGRNYGFQGNGVVLRL